MPATARLARASDPNQANVRGQRTRRQADYAIAGAAAEDGQVETSEGTRRARTHFRADSAGAHHGRGRTYTSMRLVTCSQRTCVRAVAFHEREPSEAIRCPGGQVSRSRARYG
jgi:hypothetical protein